MKENLESGIADEIVAGTAVAGILLAIKVAMVTIKKIAAYLKTSQLKLFWLEIDNKINLALDPIVKAMEDMDKRLGDMDARLHETKKTQEGVQLKTLETLERINQKLESNA